MGFVDFFFPEANKNKAEAVSSTLEKPINKPIVEPREKSVWDNNKSYNADRIIGMAGSKDSYDNVFITGEYASHEKQIVEILKEALGNKRRDIGFKKDEIRIIANKIKDKSDRAYKLAGKALIDLLEK